jgi:hypothetical protein
MVRAALELHHLRAGRHEARRVAERVLFRGLEAAEGKIGDDERGLASARHAAHVVFHLAHGHRQRGVVPLDHHAERVADQQDVDACSFRNLREARVVAGQHRQLFAGPGSFLQLREVTRIERRFCHVCCIATKGAGRPTRG